MEGCSNHSHRYRKIKYEVCNSATGTSAMARYNLKDAVVVLNHFRHDDCDSWYIRNRMVESRYDSDYYLIEFVASDCGKISRDQPIKFRFLSSESTHSDNTMRVRFTRAPLSNLETAEAIPSYGG